MEFKAREYSSAISTQIVNNINYLFENYVDRFERVAMNSTILADIYNYDELKEYRQVEVSSRIRYILASIVGIGEDIDSIEICSSSGQRFYYSYPITSGQQFESRIMREAYGSDGIVWSISQKEIADDYDLYIILAKKMQIQFAEDVTGYATMSIRREFIDSVCRRNSKMAGSYTVITDKNGIIISHPDKTQVLKSFDQSIIDRIDDFQTPSGMEHQSEPLFTIKTESGLILVAYGILPVNEWKVINIVPYYNLMESTVKNGILTLLTVLICILVAVLTSLIVTRSISIPIRQLISTMRRAGDGDLNVKIEEDWHKVNDELSLVSHGFNDMIFRLKKLIDDVYRAQLKEKELEFLKKEAELNALQQQINPHFLYNTLEAIFWTAQLKGDEEISEMVTALGDFFRTSINKGLEYVSISNEIKNVRTYVYLQKIRFANRFEVKWSIDERLMNHKTIKLVLQPIVENAIVHGIEGMESGGLITIKGYEINDKINFDVIDNGIGMSTEDVERLEVFINSSGKDTKNSIGVKNVNQRIKLYFGEEYGVNIFSTIGEGTTFRIILPMFKSELYTDYPLIGEG